MAKAIGWLKAALARFLRERSLSGTLLLGVVNGFLPCGLVYAAAASAVATGSPLRGVASMSLFGAGTIPLMLGLGLLGRKLQFTLRFKLQRLIPATLALLAFLLILRGLALGIPYPSPDLTQRNCCQP